MRGEKSTVLEVCHMRARLGQLCDLKLAPVLPSRCPWASYLYEAFSAGGFCNGNELLEITFVCVWLNRAETRGLSLTCWARVDPKCRNSWDWSLHH